MSSTLLWTAFGYLIALADAGPDLLQLRHTLRRRTIAGLSYHTQLAWTCSWACWTLYGAIAGDGPILLSGILGLFAATSLAARMWRDGARLPPSKTAATGGSYLAAALLVAWDLRTGGGVLASVDLIWFAPQLLLAARATDLTGVSAAAQKTNLALNGSWIVYAVAAGHPAAGAWGATAIAASGYLLWRLHRTRSGGSADDGTLEPPALP